MHVDSKCGCRKCMNVEQMMMVPVMIVCSVCGNKRCPRATDHDLKCTNSNEPGQVGSVYADD